MKIGVCKMAVLSVAVGIVIAGCRLDFTGAFRGGSDDFLDTGRTLSHFQAVQVDPKSEDTAGPRLIAAADLDGDQLADLISAWSQSQPLQIHLQRVDEEGEIAFSSSILAGNTPITLIADIATADFDADGNVDIAALVQVRNLSDLPGEGPAPSDGAILIFFNPGGSLALQALDWTEITLGQSELGGTYTAMDVGDVDFDGAPDIVAAVNWEDIEDVIEFDRGPGRVELFTNPSGGRERRGGEWQRFKSPTTGLLSIEARQSLVQDVVLADIDGDEDLDIVVTRPDAQTMNLRWLRNPTINTPDSCHNGPAGEWEMGAIGHVASLSDRATVGDIEGDGRVDVVVSSAEGRVIQWFKGPDVPCSESVRNIPWQVYAIAEFTERTPEGFALADVNLDGMLDLIASAQGGLAFFDPTSVPTIEDQWLETLIIDDVPSEGRTNVPPTTDPNVAPPDIAGTTSIQTIFPVDLDGNGAMDFIITLDREGLSGLTNDALVWMRNTITVPD